jgi:sarcosine oxidase
VANTPSRINPDVDIVVVGAGVMGLATAHALRAAGRDVLVLERFRQGHRHGSSHGATRIFRLAYPEPRWVRLAQEALAGWRALEAESGAELLSLVGLVELVRDVSESSREALASLGVPSRELSLQALEDEFGIRAPRGFAALFQPDAGIVQAERARAAFATGVPVREGVRVLALEPGRGGVRLETDVGLLGAGAVVVTAGAWARPLLAAAGVDLEVQPTRETVAYFRLEASGIPPAVAELQTETRRHAFYALHDPVHGLKAGLNGSGPPADPDLEVGPDSAIIERVAEWVAARVPHAAAPVRAATGLYTNTADETFVLKRHGRLVVGSACSGHGFKFAPVVGRRLARLAVEALA